MAGNGLVRLGPICLAALILIVWQPGEITQASAMSTYLDFLENHEIDEELSDDEVIGLRPQDGPDPGSENLKNIEDRQGPPPPFLECYDCDTKRCTMWANQGHCKNNDVRRYCQTTCRCFYTRDCFPCTNCSTVEVPNPYTLG